MSVGAELPVGSELLGYRIEAVLGRGGMGIVYLAEDLRLKRRVALKLLSPELAEDQRFRDRLLEESELAASLDHPNIVPIYEAGEARGRIFISMRYVEGEDLKRVLKRGSLAPELAIALVSQIASALDAAHARGLVHRDVKPSNVLIAPEAGHEGSDHVYLADFGLTRRLAEQELSAEQGQLMGTVDYVAPEQIRGDAIDGRADIYSLGCLLFECLAGAPPFRHRSDVAMLFAHLREEPPSLTASARTLPHAIDAVIAKALAKEPAERYQSARELVEAARRALGLAEPARSRLLRVSVLIALTGVSLLAALAAYLLVRGGAAPARASGGKLIRIDPATNKPAAAVSVGPNSTAVAAGDGAVWVSTFDDSSVWRIDAKTLGQQRVPANGRPVGIAVSGGTVYAGTDDPGNVTELDPNGAQLDVIETGAVSAMASGSSGIWLAAGDVLHLAQIATFLSRVVARIPVPEPAPRDEAHFRFEEAGVAVGERGVWVLGDAWDRRLWRIDPTTGRITATIALPFAPGAIAVGAGAVWVTAQLDDTLSRIDPASDRIVRTVKVGREPLGVAVGAGAVWVANTIDRTVTKIDPRSDRIVATIPVVGSPESITVGAGSVWVATDAR